MMRFVIGLAVGASMLVGCGGAELSEGAAEPTLLRSEAIGAETPVLASTAHSGVAGEVTAQACWVTLHYCRAPETSGPVCSFSDCSFERAKSACDSLVSENC